jgi:hypothetical protein
MDIIIIIIMVKGEKAPFENHPITWSIGTVCLVLDHSCQGQSIPGCLWLYA